MNTCSAQDIDRRDETAQAVAARLLGGAAVSLARIGGGRNSRVYRVAAADGRSYALKAYYRHLSQTRDRQRAEFDGLKFLWDNGLRNIPQPLAADWQQGLSLFEFIDGEKLPPPSVSLGDVETAAEFLAGLKDLVHRPGAERLLPAAEAWFCGDELLANIRQRLDRLAVPRDGDCPEFCDHHQAPATEGPCGREKGAGPRANPAFGDFMRRELLPAVERIVAWSRARLPFDHVLPERLRTLSPSDFGFHNALRRADGSWVFLDFEYFGWDDPAKMLADFLLHPAMTLSAEMKRRFVSRLLARFDDDPALGDRLRCLYPLFGLKWCIILLNEFLPEHYLRRQFAATLSGDRESVERQQLAKARRMLQQVGDEYEHFPYFG